VIGGARYGVGKILRKTESNSRQQVKIMILGATYQNTGKSASGSEYTTAPNGEIRTSLIFHAEGSRNGPEATVHG